MRRPTRAHHNLSTTNTLLRENLYTGAKYHTLAMAHHRFYTVQDLLKLSCLWQITVTPAETCSGSSYLQLEHH